MFLILIKLILLKFNFIWQACILLKPYLNKILRENRKTWHEWNMVKQSDVYSLKSKKINRLLQMLRKMMQEHFLPYLIPSRHFIYTVYTGKISRSCY